MESTPALAAGVRPVADTVAARTATATLYAAAAAGGLLIAVCFLRFALFPLAWVAFVPLLWVVPRAVSARQAAKLGFVAGLATNLPAFYWLVYTIHVFGGFGVALATLFYVTLTLFTAGQFVLFALALWRTGPGPLAVAPPLVWVCLEFLFPNLFPWRLAHTQWHVPVLLQVGDLTGPYALSFAMVWFSAGLVALGQRPRRWAPLGAAATLAAAIAAYGAVRLPAIDAAITAAPAMRVALVQGNIGLEEKGDIRYFTVNVDTYRRLSAAVQDAVDLLVWPETVQQEWIPADAVGLDDKTHPFPETRRPLIFGSLAYRLTGPREADEFNSAFIVGPDARVLGRYDKRILMPFGEYLPLSSLIPAIKEISPMSGSYTAGKTVAIFDVPGKARVGQLICYEDLLADMVRETTRGGAEVLATILNDAWYGDTAAPHQHQALALWRTVENRRYLLRGSNSGVTSIIDPAGRVVAEGGVFREEVVTGTVHPLQIETIYTRYGDVFAWMVVLGAAVLLVRGRTA